MHNLKKSLLFGLLMWLAPFLVSFFVFGIYESNRPLFESIMAVAVSGFAAFFGKIYFFKIKKDFLAEGVRLGFLWMAISVGIDLLIFLPENEFQMTLSEYISDIGITYLLIPIMTISIGKMLQHNSK